MHIWMGECHVHAGIDAADLDRARAAHPGAELLIHPECGCTSSTLYRMSTDGLGGPATVVASTEGMVRRSAESPATTFIVATEVGIIHRMRQLAPGKTLIEAPTAGTSATCKSCAHCPWMAMNALQGVVDCLTQGSGEISVPEPTRSEALGCIERMLDFVATHPSSTATPTRGFVANIGAA